MNQDLRNFIHEAGIKNPIMVIQALEGAGFVNFQCLTNANISDLVYNLNIELHDSFKLFRKANNQIYPTDEEIQMINQAELTHLPVLPIVNITQIQQKFYLLIVIGAPQSGKDTFISMCINTLRNIKYDDYIRYMVQKQSNQQQDGFNIYYEQDIVFLRCPDPGQQQFSKQLYDLINPLMKQIIDYRILYVDNSKVQRLGIRMIHSIQRSLEWITSLDKVVLIQTFNNTKTITGALFIDKSPIADFLIRFSKDDKIIEDRCILIDQNLYSYVPNQDDIFNNASDLEVRPYMISLNQWKLNKERINNLFQNLRDRQSMDDIFSQIQLFIKFEQLLQDYLKNLTTYNQQLLQISDLQRFINQIDQSQLIHIQFAQQNIAQMDIIFAPFGAYFLICQQCNSICHKACRHGSETLNSVEQIELIKKCQKFRKSRNSDILRCVSCIKRVPGCDGLAETHKAVQQYRNYQLLFFNSYFLIKDNKLRIHQLKLDEQENFRKKSLLRAKQNQQLQFKLKQMELMTNLKEQYKQLNQKVEDRIRFNLQIRINYLQQLQEQDQSGVDQGYQQIMKSYNDIQL